MDPKQSIINMIYFNYNNRVHFYGPQAKHYKHDLLITRSISMNPKQSIINMIDFNYNNTVHFYGPQAKHY